MAKPLRTVMALPASAAGSIAIAPVAQGVKTRQASATMSINQAQAVVVRGNARPDLRFSLRNYFGDAWVSPVAAVRHTDDERKANMMWTAIQVDAMGVTSWHRLDSALS